MIRTNDVEIFNENKEINEIVQNAHCTRNFRNLQVCKIVQKLQGVVQRTDKIAPIKMQANEQFPPKKACDFD